MVRALRDRLRGHARAVLENSLLHIQAHLVSRCGLQEVGHHAGVPRRGLPPPSALLGARIRRAQTACIVALGASSVLVRPTEAGTSRTQRGVEDHCSPPGKPRQVWFPGLISSSRIASRAKEEEEMLRLGRTGHARRIPGPFPWFFAFFLPLNG